MQISVIIPVYNAEPFLRKAVESALQFEEVKEVLLIEDASPDNALALCKQLAEEDHRVKLLQHPDKKNHGAGASRNLGILNAKHEYIAFLDADDFYLQNRFDEEKYIFVQHTDIDGVYNAIGTYFYSVQAKKKFIKTFLNEITTVRKEIAPENLFSSIIGIGGKIGYFHLDGLTLKKEALHKMNMLFNADMKLHQDSDFNIRLTYYCKLMGGNLKKAVALRGVHSENRIINIQFNLKNKTKEEKKLADVIFKWAKNSNLDIVFVNHLRKKLLRKKLLSMPFFIPVLYLLKFFSLYK